MGLGQVCLEEEEPREKKGESASGSGARHTGFA